MADKISVVNKSVLFLDDDELKQVWFETLFKVTHIKQVVPMVHGSCCKILYDIKFVDNESTAIEFSKALSHGNEPSYSAAWLEGFLKDAATILILDDDIWNITNNWIASIDAETFVQVVPLLRRTFAVYNAVEKSKIAQKVKYQYTSTPKSVTSSVIDTERAKRVLPVLEKLFGLN